MEGIDWLISSITTAAKELGFYPDAEVAWVYFTQDEKYEMHIKKHQKVIILYNNELETYEVLDLARENMTASDFIDKMKKFIK